MSNSFDINQLNTLLEQASDSILCNSHCQKERKTEKLKQNYLQSQTNLATAPHNVEVAQKKYIEFTEGTAAYNEFLDSQLTEKAETIADKFTETFNNEVDKISSQISSYDGILLSYNYAVELLRKYSVENIKLESDLKNQANDVLTNERKTYYQDQGVDNLKFYYHYFLLGIYIICLICFGIFIFIYPSQYKFIIKIIILIFFIALPLFSTWILGIIIKLLNTLINVLPKNVYKDDKLAETNIK